MAERLTVARLREDQIEAAADLMNLVFFEQLRVASRPPNTLDRDEEERREFGTDQLENIFRDSLSHLYLLNQLLGKLRREQMGHQPHWFLPSRLDVNPAHYGKGIATELLRPVLQRC